MSQQAISLIEQGHGSKLAGDTMRRAFAAVDARWEATVSWRGGELDRLLDDEHARLVAAVVQMLASLGWEVAVEVTYSEYGERGSIDVLAARLEALAVVSVEVKSDLTVLEATVRKTDEKDRLVRRMLTRERFGFQPRSVGRLLVLPASDRSRRRVARSAVVLDAALPARGQGIRAWLRAPAGDLAGILFIANTNRRSANGARGGAIRVRRRVERSS